MNRPELSLFLGVAEVLQHLQDDAGMFYESVVASSILFAVIYRVSTLRVKNPNRLNQLIQKASHVGVGGCGVRVSDLSVREENVVQDKDNIGQSLKFSMTYWSGIEAHSVKDSFLHVVPLPMLISPFMPSHWDTIISSSSSSYICIGDLEHWSTIISISRNQ